MLILLEHDRSLDLKPYRVGNGPETTSASELAGNNALNVGRVAGWAADIAIRTCGATFFENSSKKCGAVSVPAATLIVVVAAVDIAVVAVRPWCWVSFSMLALCFESGLLLHMGSLRFS